MMRLMIAGAVLTASAIAAEADGAFWVVGNRAANKCQIVTRNPVMTGDIWFGDGPYKSKDDAKLARSTIPACPRLTPEQEKDEDGAN
jgi:hypothetical protein